MRLRTDGKFAIYHSVCITKLVAFPAMVGRALETTRPNGHPEHFACFGRNCESYEEVTGERAIKFDSNAVKKISGFSTFAIVTAFAPCTGWTQTLPKQGAIDATYTAAGADVREIGTSGDDAVYLYESTLVMTNNSKTPLLQNITAHCVEAGFTAGAGNGYCVYSDKDGDKFVEAFNRPHAATSGKATLVSGTGKYKGIQGQLDWQVVQALPAEKGSFHYVGKKTGSYRLP